MGLRVGSDAHLVKNKNTNIKKYADGELWAKRAFGEASGSQ